MPPRFLSRRLHPCFDERMGILEETNPDLTILSNGSQNLACQTASQFSAPEATSPFYCYIVFHAPCPRLCVFLLSMLLFSRLSLLSVFIISIIVSRAFLLHQLFVESSVNMDCHARTTVSLMILIQVLQMGRRNWGLLTARI